MVYPPLSVPANPTVQDIVNAWHQPPPANAWWAPTFNDMSPYDFIQSVAQQYGKPVLMTEAGYLSVDYNGQISGVTGLAGPLNVQEQADAYQAFFQVWGPSAGSWLQGVEFWNWDLDGKYSPNGFSPMGKPAQAIVTAFFKGQGALASDVASLTATDIANLAALGIKSLAVTDHVVDLSAAQKAALGANGITLTEPYGTGSQTWTFNSDGFVHDVAYYSISGNTATTTDYVYMAGMMDAGPAAVVSPTGLLHEVTVTGITGQKWTSSDTIYGANAKPVSATWHNGATLIQSEAWNPDGSIHDIHYYAISGQAYTDYDLVYDANGRKGEAVYSNGMTQSWSYNADGSLHEAVVAGVTGASSTSTDTIYGPNGKPLFETWRNGSTVTQTETWNADGSIHDIHVYGAPGQPDATYDLIYGPNGRKAEAVYAGGLTQTWSYTPDGLLYESTLSGISGAAYASSITGFGSNGQSVVHEYANLDGTQTIRGLVDDLTFTSAATVNDVTTRDGVTFGFASDANATLTGGGANETFVLDAGFGHATITDFAQGHDALVFAPGTFTDLRDALSHAVQSGGNLVLTDHAGDTLVLQNASLAQLAAGNIRV